MRVAALVVLFVLFTAACSTEPEPVVFSTLAPTLEPLPENVLIGSTVTGTLTSQDLPKEFQFFSTAGEIVQLIVEEPNIQLTLLDANMTILAEGAAIEALLADSGRYMVEMRLLSGDESAYTFTLSHMEDLPPTPGVPTRTPLPVVVGFPTPTPVPFASLGTLQATLTSVSPAFGAINDAGEKHIYTFQGRMGSYVRLRMERTSGTVDPALTLYDPVERALAYDDNSGGGRTALIRGVRLPADGIYAVLASGEGQTGTYQLTLETGELEFPLTPMSETLLATPLPTQPPILLTPPVPPGVSGGLLEDHHPVSGFIEREGGVQRFSIQADFGEVFTIGLKPGIGFAPQMELLSPSGAISAETSALGGDGELIIPNFEAASTGTYVVFISGVNGSTGSYTLSYGRNSTREEIRQGEAFADRIYDNNFARRAVRHVWYVNLNAGDLITASATNVDGAFNPVIEMIHPDGSRVIQQTGTGGGTSALIRSARADVPGTYAFYVHAEEPESMGTYSFIWRYVEAAATATPPVAVADLFTADDRLTVGEFVYYPYQGVRGERLLIEVEGIDDSGLDPIVAILNPNGDVLGEDDDGGGGLNPRLMTILPEDGVYTIRVGGYNSGGGYILRVRRVF